MKYRIRTRKNTRFPRRYQYPQPITEGSPNWAGVALKKAWRDRGRTHVKGGHDGTPSANAQGLFGRKHEGLVIRPAAKCYLVSRVLRRSENMNASALLSSISTYYLYVSEDVFRFQSFSIRGLPLCARSY